MEREGRNEERGKRKERERRGEREGRSTVISKSRRLWLWAKNKPLFHETV